MSRKARAPSVAREALALRHALRRLAKPAGAFDASRYFRGTSNLGFYNVRAEDVRRLARDLAKKHTDDWSVDDAIALADTLVKDRFLEVKNVGIETVARFRKHFARSHLPTWKRWLAANHSDNWATTDTLCGALIGPLLVAEPRATVLLHQPLVQTQTGRTPGAEGIHLSVKEVRIAGQQEPALVRADRHSRVSEGMTDQGNQDELGRDRVQWSHLLEAEPRFAASRVVRLPAAARRPMATCPASRWDASAARRRSPTPSTTSVLRRPATSPVSCSPSTAAGQAAVSRPRPDPIHTEHQQREGDTWSRWVCS